MKTFQKRKEEKKLTGPKRDRYGGWYDEQGVYYSSKGLVAFPPKSVPPDQKRFINHLVLPDGSGIQTVDGQVFLFNQKGGWYDEYFNYYNKDGEPEESPSDSEYQSNEDSRKKNLLCSEGQEADDEKDELYQGLSPDEEEEEEEKDFEEDRNFRYQREASTKNMQILKKIDKLSQMILAQKTSEEIRISINRLPENITAEDLLDFVVQITKEKLVFKEICHQPIILHRHKYNRWFLKMDRDSALKFLTLEGKILKNYSINLAINPCIQEEKDSSDDENELFSSDHLMDKQSCELLYTCDKKFKNGEEDFKITTEKKKQNAEQKTVISRQIPVLHSKSKEEKKN